MTLRALSLEGGKESPTPRVLFGRWRPSPREPRGLPAGRRCEGPTPPASALAPQRQPAGATASCERRRPKLRKHMWRNRHKAAVAAPGGPQAAWDADSSEHRRGQGYVNRRSKPKPRWPFSVINVRPLCATAFRPPSSLSSLGFTGTQEETHPCGFGGLSFS